MAWFKNKKEMTPSAPTAEETPALPELSPLPRLPDFPVDIQYKPNALPRFPSSPIGNKFSQNTIKEAITGEKEGEEEANESEEMQMMPRLPAGPLIRESPSFEEPMAMEKSMSLERPMNLPSSPIVRETRSNPMFVRLDKFEENLEVFDKIKKQLVGVERIIDEIKRTKEEEDKQMAEWEDKLKTMKAQIEKIDKDIFSKID